MKQRSQEWFDARKGKVTASIAGAILDVCPYMTRDDALRAKVRELHGAESEFVDNPAVAWGVANEDTAIASFELESGLKVDPGGYFEYEGWLGASPDGLIGDGAVLEVKSPYGLRKGGEFKSIHDLPHYFMQVQVQLLCTGREKAYFYQWSPHGSKLEIVEKDYIDFEELLDFWQEVHECDPTPHLEPLRVDLTGNNRAVMLLREYDELREAKDNADQRMKEIVSELQEASKGKNAIIGNRKLTKVERQGSVKYAQVVKDHCPDVDLTEYRGNGSTSWRLT